MAAVYFLSDGGAAKFRADQMTSALPFEDAAAADSAAVKSFNHQLFRLKFWSVSIQRTDGVPQSRTPNDFRGKTKGGNLASDWKRRPFKRRDAPRVGRGVGGDFEKLELGALAVLGTQEVLTSHTGGFPH